MQNEWLEPTGLVDKNGNNICLSHILHLDLDDGTGRDFVVQRKTVVRKVKNHPNFVEGYSKVAITGIVFQWNGYDLFPCVDEDGISDNEKMEIVGIVTPLGNKVFYTNNMVKEEK